MSRLGSPLSNAANAKMTAGKTIEGHRINWEQIVTMKMAETEKLEPRESTSSYVSISRFDTLVIQPQSTRIKLRVLHG